MLGKVFILDLNFKTFLNFDTSTSVDFVLVLDEMLMPNEPTIVIYL